MAAKKGGKRKGKKAIAKKDKIDRLSDSLVLDKASSLPWPLPAGHVTSAAHFSDIVESLSVEPTRCAVFGRDLLYLSYGGLHHRRDSAQTQDSAMQPIGLLFGPKHLQETECYYPFDTGAMSGPKPRYGKRWKNRMKPWKKKWRLPGDGFESAAAAVRALYGSNMSYLFGQVRSGGSRLPDPLPLLLEFLRADLTSRGVDHRKNNIECLFSHAIPLDRALVWIGYPLSQRKHYLELLTKAPFDPPYRYEYLSHQVFNPYVLSHELDSAARLYAANRYMANETV